MRERVGSVSPVYEVFKVDRGKIVPEIIEMQIRASMPTFMDILKPGAREGQPIDRKRLLEKNITIPDRPLQEVFHSHLSLFQSRIDQCEIETNTIVELRDTLLPKLILGELRVKAAEKIVEAVA